MARPPRGARFAFALLALALAVRPCDAARSDSGRGPLPWRAGADIGFTVDAASFPDSAGQMLEVYVRLAPATLMTLAAGRPEGGRFTLALTMRSPYGRLEHKLDQDFVASGGDTAGGFGKVVILPFRITPGEHGLKLRMSTVRPSAVRGMTGRTQVETVEGELDVPAPEHGGLLSDIGFIWPEPASETPPSRGGRLPNPERLYGRYADSLRARFVARSQAGDQRPWLWVARILDSGGRVVSTLDGTGAPGPRLEATVVSDVSREPAGGYDLEVKAWQEGDTGALLRRARFSVAWEAPTWVASAEEIIDNAHFLLSRDEEQAFEHLQPGEQERVMTDFWRLRDPTPDTGVNETHDTFMKRADFANRTYGRYGLGKGMFSDMGRVFIRYGEPSEVLKQVIPTRDNTLAEMIRQLAAADGREVGNVNDKVLGADMRPFEVWIYEGDIPLPVDAEPPLGRLRIRNRRLVFLFVDEQWVGDYRLRYTTE